MKKYKLLIALVAVLVVASVSLAFAGGNLQGLIFKMRTSDPSKAINTSGNSTSCTDSDGGKNYFVKGVIDGKLSGGQNYTAPDSCNPSSFGDLGEKNVGQLREYYCDENGYINFEDHKCLTSTQCYQGSCQYDKSLALKELRVGCTNPWASNYDSTANAENDSCYRPLRKKLQVPITRPFPLDNEKPIPPVYLHDDSTLVIVPGGYEKYGEKILQDFKYCKILVPKFLGIKPNHYWEDLIVKIYIVNDGQSISSYNPETGNITYAKKQENLDMDLAEVLNNSPDGFLYKSSPFYCANSHEYTHFVVSNSYIVGWVNEGIAEYTQKFTQAGSKDYFTCKEDGFVMQDFWGDDKVKLFRYSNLNEAEGNEPGDGSKWYRSAGCFWELFENKFGSKKIQEFFQLLMTKGDGSVQLNEQRTKFLIEEVFFKVVDEYNLKPILDKFGFVKDVDYVFN